MQHVTQLKSLGPLIKGPCALCLLVLIGCSSSSKTPAELPESAASSSNSAPAEKPSRTKQVEPQDHSLPQEVDALKDNDQASRQAEIPRVMPPSFSCGEHTCFRFDTAKDALVPLILSHMTRLIAFGEAHAPADYTGRSTVLRFQEELLPTLSRGTSHLLVELLQPPQSGCEPQKEAAKKESQAVTEGQSQNNQNEYLALGTKAHELGVRPDILHATCEDLKKIAKPDGGVVAMMESIARLSEKALTDDLSSTKPGRPLVLAYGGALHNDVTPRQGREMWSYGPHLLKVSEGSYLEIDLIIPELIKDTDSWKSFEWYSAYESLGHKEGAILMKWGSHSYSLFFAPEPEQ